MPHVFTHEFDTPVFKGKTSFSTGLYIDGKFVDAIDGQTSEYVLSLFRLLRHFANCELPLQCREPDDWQSHHVYLTGQ